MTDWRWSEDGLPALDIMPGFEITPLRVGDEETWARLDPGWENGTGDKETLRRNAFKTVKRRSEEIVPWAEAMRKGEPVPSWNAWMARDKSNGLAVCRIWFNDKDDDDPPGTRNIGWGTIPEYQRKGIAKAALVAVLNNFVPLMDGVHEVRANCRQDNAASLGMMRSAGFENIGETSAEAYADRPQLSGDGMVINFRKVIQPLKSEGEAKPA